MAATVEQELSDIIAEAMGELEYLQANALSFQGAIRDKVAIERGQLQAIIDAIHSAVATQSHQELSSIRDSYRSVLTSIENNIQADLANVQNTAESAGATPIDLSALIAGQAAVKMAPSIAATPPLIPPASTQATQGIAATTTAPTSQGVTTLPPTAPWNEQPYCGNNADGTFGIVSSYLATYVDPNGTAGPYWTGKLSMKYFDKIPLLWSDKDKYDYVVANGAPVPGDMLAKLYVQGPQLIPSCQISWATGTPPPPVVPPPPPPIGVSPPPPLPTIVDCCDQLKAIADSLATIVGYRVAYFEGNGGDYIKDKMSKFLAVPKEQVFNDKTLDDITKDLFADADFAGFITKVNP